MKVSATLDLRQLIDETRQAIKEEVKATIGAIDHEARSDIAYVNRLEWRHNQEMKAEILALRTDITKLREQLDTLMQVHDAEQDQ